MTDPYISKVTTRSFCVFLLFVFLYSIIIWRLANIQIFQSTTFTSLANKQYSLDITSKPHRAYIYDINNNILACNQPSISLFTVPKDIKNPKAVFDFVYTYYPESLQRLKTAYIKSKKFMYIARCLDEETFDQLKQYIPEDIQVLHDTKRYYPYAESISPVLGITDIDADGILGIEQTFNSMLQGSPTLHTIKKDARSQHFYFEKTTHIQGQDSIPITLTIDGLIQWKAYNIVQQACERFQASQAGAVIMNPDTGAIQALISYPSFDPHNTKNLDIKHTQNNSISKAFEVGSVMKTFAAAAALQEHIVTPAQTFDCQNTKETKIDGLRVRTVKPHGILSFADIIQKSNNIGTILACKPLGETLYEYYTRVFGFGNLCNITLPGEHKGFVNHPANWSGYSIHSLCYGYEISATLLQLARATSIIANGGYMVHPHLIPHHATITQQTKLLDSQTIQDMRTILQNTIEHGTGRRARIKSYDVFGKTGTAYLAESGTYNEKKKLYTFIGWVEKDNYKRVITLYIKEAQKERYSATVAAPVFKELAEMILLHDHIV